MTILLLTLLAIVASDLTLKVLLRRVMGTAAMSLGPFGSIQLTDGQLWLQRLRKPSRAKPSHVVILWCLWIAAAAALLMGGKWLALSPLFVGLLLGGSLSNALEQTGRGAVSDYVCLRFWPAFNLADTAVALGAAGIVIELVLRLAA